MTYQFGEVFTAPHIAVTNHSNSEAPQRDTIIEVPTAPPVTVPNNADRQATPEYTVLVITLLIAAIKADPSTINAWGSVIRELRRFLIRIIWALKRKAKTPDKK